MTRRPWSETDYAAVRAAAEDGVPVPELARRLARTPSAVHQARFRLGLGARRPRYGPAFDAFVRDRHAEGMADPEIVAAWRAVHGGRLETHTVCSHRAAMGLPHNAGSARQRARVAAKTAADLAAGGYASMADRKRDVVRDRNERQGWPADLRPREAQMLDAMWDRGPMTRRELADAVGMPWRRNRSGRRGERNRRPKERANERPTKGTT